MADYFLTPIDPHVHMRGLEYGTPYAQWAIEDADSVGLAAILEQPNPKPWLVDSRALMARKRQITDIYESLWRDEAVAGLPEYRAHIGMTTDYEQAVRAIQYAKDHRLAIKIFFVHSTGNMGILDEAYQRWLWQTIAMIGFEGPVIGHFELESAFQGEFDPANPVSHSKRQHENAELLQVVKQLENAKATGFRGIFYVAHASSPKTVNYLKSTKDRGGLPFEIVIEATFHHLLLNWDDYKIHGNRVKMNPPLRSPQSQKALLAQYLEGLIDVIGTDHAPHPVEAKDSDKPPSGIPALPFWPRGIELLREAGASEDLIEKTTFYNANEVFGLGLDPESIVREYDESLWDKYGFNPFSRLS